MMKNFYLMPFLLKCLTLVGGFLPVWVVGSLMPDGKMRVLGREVSNLDWWLSGSGFLVLFAAVCTCASSILMLRRNTYARTAYVFGAVVSAVPTPFFTFFVINDYDRAARGLISGLIGAVMIAGYLFISKSCSEYFSKNPVL